MTYVDPYDDYYYVGDITNVHYMFFRHVNEQKKEHLTTHLIAILIKDRIADRYPVPCEITADIVRLEYNLNLSCWEYHTRSSMYRYYAPLTVEIPSKTMDYTDTAYYKFSMRRW